MSEKITRAQARAAKIPAQRLFSRANGQRVLDVLADGSPPFLAVAAERAGLNRNTVYDWVRIGELPGCADQDLVWFALEARRLRSEWIARVSREIMQAGKDDQYSSKHKAWMLERVERDLFDLSRVHLPKDRTKVRPLPEPEGVVESSEAEVLDELARPEIHGPH